jgi:hypothetical protein
VFLPHPTRECSNLRRWIGAVLFLFFFSLPFHVHAVTVDDEHVTQECSCYCGGLSQLGSAPTAVVLTVVYQIYCVPDSRIESSATVTVEYQHARDPPISL